MRRTFIVGCPRSGTTIVQAMLARHPAIYSLPETSFFMHLLGGASYRWGDPEAKTPRRRLARRLGIARRYGRREFVRLQQHLLGETASAHAPLSEQACVACFFATLDQLTEQAGRTMWLEKTPMHLLYLDEIERYLPDARFIHVIRPGMDVIASLLDANLRYGADHAFGGDLARWAGRWNRAAEIHRQHIGDSRHHFIFLEDLTRDPESTWQRLCTFLELPTTVSLDDTCRQTISDPALEPWKKAALSGKPQPTASKVHDMFGPGLCQWLQQKLASYDALYAAGGAPGRRDTSPSVQSRRGVRLVEAAG